MLCRYLHLAIGQGARRAGIRCQPDRVTQIGRSTVVASTHMCVIMPQITRASIPDPCKCSSKPVSRKELGKCLTITFRRPTVGWSHGNPGVRIWQEKGCPGPVRDMLDVYGRPALPRKKSSSRPACCAARSGLSVPSFRRKIIVLESISSRS